MALLDDAIEQIADEALRNQIRKELEKLKRRKKFGIVFEDHLPELVPLYDAQPRKHDRVSLKKAPVGETWKVVSISGNKVVCDRESPGEPQRKTFSVDEVVVTRKFGESVFPALELTQSIETDPNKPAHVLIEADNYHALQLLDYVYRGQVDCIYIDPPYNSGARDWKYNNDFVDKKDGWRHSKWLSMMKRRLELAARLLKHDGVLIVTIDENEVHHLGMLLEDLFPQHLRHVVSIVINPKGTGKHNFARVDEYAIFCVPNLGRSVISGTPTKQTLVSDELATEEGEEEEDEDEDALGSAEEDEEDLQSEAIELLDKAPFPPEEADLWELRHARRRCSESSYRHQRPNQFYALYLDEHAGKIVKAGPSLSKEAKPSFSKSDGLTPIWPIDHEGNDRCWRFIPEKMQRLIDENRVVLGRFNTEKKTWTVNIWERKPASRKLKTVWWESIYDAGTHGTTLLHKMLGKRGAFPFPKSVYAVRDCLAAVVRDRPNALIVDFFAGSGTTMHATALLNALDNGARRCVLVTNNEVSGKQEKELKKKGLGPSDAKWADEGICRSVTIPRCVGAITGKRPDGKAIEGSYFTGRLIQTVVSRQIKHVTLGAGSYETLAKRKEMLGLLGLTQSKANIDTSWHIEEGVDTAVLWDATQADSFAASIGAKASGIRTILVCAQKTSDFRNARKHLMLSLPPCVSITEETRQYAEGLNENLQCFHLNFLDPDSVEVGNDLARLLPTLWLMAGAQGGIPKAPASKAYLAPVDTPFAILLKESAGQELIHKLQGRTDISRIFIVTNSEDAFYRLRDDIGSVLGLKYSIFVHLYRNYLDNFRINGGTA